MKQLVILIALLLCLNGYSQITADFQLPVRLYPVRLNNSEVKYVDEAVVEFTAWPDQFALYNPDGTLFRTLQMPPKPNPTAFLEHVSWISTTLFDTDPSTIEYLIAYNYDSLGYSSKQTTIAREDGTILLDEVNATPFYFTPLVYGTEQGTKLMLFYQYAYTIYVHQTKVFSLPGDPPAGDSSDEARMKDPVLLYPNPNSGAFFLKLGPDAEKGSKIELYSITGNLIGTYSSAGDQVYIDKSGLEDGVYLVNTRTGRSNSIHKMIIRK